MKLIGVLTTCLVADAAARFRPKPLNARLAEQMSSINKDVNDQTDLKKQYQQKIRQERSDFGIVPETPDKVVPLAVTDAGAKEHVRFEADVHAVTTRHPATSSSPIVEMAMARSKPWQTSHLHSVPIYNADSLLDMSNFDGLPLKEAVFDAVGGPQNKLGTIGLSLSTGAPAIKFVEQVMKGVNGVEDNVYLTGLEDKYGNFMQKCEEQLLTAYYNFYSIFEIHRDAANVLGSLEVFKLLHADTQNYLLTEASATITRSKDYIKNVIDSALEMRNSSQLLKDEMQKLEVMFTRQRDSNSPPEVRKLVAKGAILEKEERELESKEEELQKAIKQIDEAMDATTAELQKKILERKDLASDIIPEKREQSPAHWRMFYEELCSWWEDWNCQYDATHVFQWVVDPSAIKKQYLTATKEINDLTRLNQIRLEKKLELQNTRNTKLQHSIEFTKHANDGLYVIAELSNPRKEDIYSIIEAGKMYLDKVHKGVALIATRFFEWEKILDSVDNKRDTSLRAIESITTGMEDKAKSEILKKDLLTKSHNTAMKTIDEVIGDMVFRAVQSRYGAEDIELYRQYMMTTVSTMSDAELFEYVTDADLEIETGKIKDLLVSKMVLSEARHRSEQ